MITLYHNPRCSKSRKTFELLQDREEPVEIIEYLKTPPSEQMMGKILDLLKLKPRDLIRKTETVYKTLGLNDLSLSDEELVKAMIKHPILIERPIVLAHGKAAIGRPPEAVLEIL